MTSNYGAARICWAKKSKGLHMLRFAGIVRGVFSRLYCLLAGWVLVLGPTHAASPELPKALRPNVVLIFVDDLGYGDLTCYGNTKIKTPHLDRLAKEGQRWTSFYSSGSTCVPSRTGLMSGRHPALVGSQKLAAAPEKLLPVMFKRQGYATAILGKWHLAGYPKDFTQSPMHPLECGFDYHFGTPGSNDVPAPLGKRQTREVFDHCTKFSFPVPLIRGRKVVEHPTNQELLTRRYTAEAVKWIRTPREKPFFLYLAHNMPHAPIFASKQFQGSSDGGRYGDVIEEIDWSVGRVMAALKLAKLDTNTLSSSPATMAHGVCSARTAVPPDHCAARKAPHGKAAIACQASFIGPEKSNPPPCPAWQLISTCTPPLPRSPAASSHKSCPDIGLLISPRRC